MSTKIKETKQREKSDKYIPVYIIVRKHGTVCIIIRNLKARTWRTRRSPAHAPWWSPSHEAPYPDLGQLCPPHNRPPGCPGPPIKCGSAKSKEKLWHQPRHQISTRAGRQAHHLGCVEWEDGPLLVGWTRQRTGYAGSPSIGNDHHIVPLCQVHQFNHRIVALWKKIVTWWTVTHGKVTYELEGEEEIVSTANFTSTPRDLVAALFLISKKYKLLWEC